MTKNFKKSTAEFFITEQAPEAEPAQKKEYEIPKGYRLIQEQKSVRLQLLIRPTTKEKIKEIAALHGESVNELINNILEDYINHERT